MFISLCACKEHMVYSTYKSLDNGIWYANDTIRFEVAEQDTLAGYNMFINVRNDDDYPFSNLFLITEMESPTGQITIDTLEYGMARPNGSWLGKGMGSTKESKLWYRENIVFPDLGVYTVKISHAMRKNGEVEGLQELKGITDVGLEIENRE